MVSSTLQSASGYATGPALLSSICGNKRPFSATLHDSNNNHNADPTQKRSPLLCGYPSKKCWAWRVEKRNGELHKFCEYHRQKANTNQRRMEQRRKNGRATQKGDVSSDGDAASTVKEESVTSSATKTATKTNALKSEPESNALKTSQLSISAHIKTTPTINTAMANSESAKKHMAMTSASAMASTPRGVDDFDSLSPPLFSWAEVDLDIGMDAAVEYMMIDHAIDSEPSDKPVDLYEEDLYFLEHFIAEIATSNESSPHLTDASAVTSQLKRLEVLRLCDVPGSERVLEQLAQLPALRELEIKSIGLSHKPLQLQRLLGGAKLPLERLTLWNLCLAHLEFLALCPKLQHLEFCGAADLSMLAAATELRTLKLWLCVDGNGEDAAPIDLSPLRALRKLTHLELYSNQRGVVRIASIPALLSLQTLHVPELDDYDTLCKRQRRLSSLVARHCTQADLRRTSVLSPSQFLNQSSSS